MGEAELAAAGRPVVLAIALEDHVLGELGGPNVVPGQGLRLGDGERAAVTLADIGDHRPGRELEGPEIAAAGWAELPLSQTPSRATTTSLRCSTTGVQVSSSSASAGTGPIPAANSIAVRKSAWTLSLIYSARMSATCWLRPILRLQAGQCEAPSRSKMMYLASAEAWA